MVNIDIVIDGNKISKKIEVESIKVKREINNVPKANVIVNDGNTILDSFEISNDDLFTPGKEIEIKAGNNRRIETIFKGIIIKLSILSTDGTPKLMLECYDQTIKLTVGRKSRIFTEMTDSDIITEITNHNGLNSGLQFASAPIAHNKLVQYNCTDWDFIVARADANGMLCIPNDGEIIVENPKLDERPVAKLNYGNNIISFDAEIDSRNQLSKVISKSWDYSNQEMCSKEGNNPGISIIGNMESSNLANVIGLDSYTLEHGGKLNDDELQAWSDSLMLKRQLAKVRGRIRTKGSDKIKPGKLVAIKGLGDRFNGNAFVSGIEHSIVEGEWEMDIQVGSNPQWFTERKEISERPASGLLAAFRGLQAGIVTQIDDDPEGQDRVQVKIPVIDSNDGGIWARVATLDAGNNRGTFFRPEIDDEVIVGFVNDDPRDPVILGMMNSSAKPAPFVAQSNNAQKGIVTRSKLKLVFDDDEKKILMETPAGKNIVLNEDKDDITISDNHQNKIVMDKNGILIESQSDINIKANHDLKFEGLNTEMIAQSTAKITGSAEAKLESGGIATVIGSLVKIN